jgi:hypothetical protein
MALMQVESVVVHQSQIVYVLVVSYVLVSLRTLDF